MNVTHKITMDLTRPTNGNRINVVEGDKNSRIVNVHLYENSVSWRVPTDASVLIKWERESGVGGEYSQLSDGSSAWSAVGNILTITLSEESTEYSGNVKFSIVLTSGDSQISTFVIVANVHAVANGREGANSGASSTDIAGLQKQIGNLSDLETKNKSNLVAAINEAAKSGGGSGETGADGGYYTPKVSQPTAVTMQMAFTPSREDMPAVAPVNINLPVGSGSSQNGYELPIATPEKLGGVKPVSATSAMTQEVGVDAEGKLFTKPGGGSGGGEVDISTLTAYEAGDVKAIKRSDAVFDQIIPMMNTRYFQNCSTIAIEPEQTDGKNNLIHEATIVGPSNSLAAVVYLENMTGSSEDYAVSGKDIRVRCKILNNQYGITSYESDQIKIGDTVDIMYPGVSMNDGAVAVGGFGTCTAFVSGGRVFVLARGYVTASKVTFCVSYADFPTSAVSAPPTDIEWSAPQTMTLTANGETVEYTEAALASACGLSDAIIQANNQVWVSNSTFYMAVNIRYQGVAILTSSDGINWTFMNFVTTKYKCRFLCECACAINEGRMWIACRNDEASNTMKRDKSFTNYLTLLKVNTSTWTVVDEYNIPDCGCKPFFVAPAVLGRISDMQGGTKPLLLMHNPYTREAAEILMIGDYPMYSLGEIRGGANYITGFGNLSAGTLQNMMTCGTNDLVTDRKGALVHCHIAIRERAALATPLNEWASMPNSQRVEYVASNAWHKFAPGVFYVITGEYSVLNYNLLTPTNNNVVNEYRFMFNSGATATKLYIPTGVITPEGFAVEANKTYEITICEGKLSYRSWPYSAQ